MTFIGVATANILSAVAFPLGTIRKKVALGIEASTHCPGVKLGAVGTTTAGLFCSTPGAAKGSKPVLPPNGFWKFFKAPQETNTTASPPRVKI